MKSVLRSEVDIAMHALRYDFVHKLFYLLHYKRYGATWLNSWWWLLSYRYRKYVIEIAKTFGGWTFGAKRRPTSQRKDFELILTVKMETRHPVGGIIWPWVCGICNRCRVMTAWNSKTWNFFLQFLRFWKNDSLGSYCIKFSKFCSESLHGDTDWRCVEMS